MTATMPVIVTDTDSGRWLPPLVTTIDKAKTNNWICLAGMVSDDGDVTECIVCVPGHDPLTFLSCPFPFWLGGSFMAPII